MWSDLPPDLLELILQKIVAPELDDTGRYFKHIRSFKHILSFKSVCPSWRTVAKSCSSYRAPSRSPWFLFGFDDEDSGLFDPATRKVLKLKNVFNDFRNYPRCVGSSHGWIVILHRDKDLSQSGELAHVFNPITRTSISIPDTSSLLSTHNINKGIISSNPSSNKDFYVVVAWSNGLALSKHGDKSWTKFGDASSYTGDIMFHNDKLLALTLGNLVSILEVWDCRGSKPMKTMHIENITGLRPFKIGLVESLVGDVLHVTKGCMFRNSSIMVEKLNLAEEKWEEVTSLGDEVLVVYGYDRLMSFTSLFFLGCDERDSVNIYEFKNSYIWNGIQSLCSRKCVWVHPNPW